MILRRLWNRLLLRTTLVVLGGALAVGMLALALAGNVASRWERAHQQEAIQAQVDGVVSVASAACFVEDRGLAEEIVTRLVGTRNVQSAVLLSHQSVLAQASRGNGLLGRASGTFTRSIPSPFFKEVQVGELLLVPDPAEAERLGRHTAALLRMVVFGVTCVLGLTLACTTQQAIIRPITIVSERLHRLDPETGILLTAPPGHEGDEIGRLVRDVNVLVERLVSATRNGRELSGLLTLDCLHPFSLRDSLTGALNRHGAEHALAVRLARGFDGLGLMRVDLQLVDSSGGRSGTLPDEVLRQVTARLGTHLRGLDLVARLGGHDFLLILDSLTDEAVAMDLARQVIAVLCAPMPLVEGDTVQLSVNIGIVLSDPVVTSSQLTLLSQAGQALDQAKQAGCNQCMVFRD